MDPHAQANFHLADGVSRAASFTNRPPSPPYIHIPTPLGDNTQSALTITPSYDFVDSSLLSVEDINIITGKRDQRATSVLMNHLWRYEDRRNAQPILDFLYLGPLSVIRNRTWLQQEGITMLLAARDAAMAQARFMSLDKIAAELGIEAAHVDVAGRQELIRSFPAAVAKINDHLLRVYKSQAQQVVVGEGQQVTAIDTSTFRRGKVLLICETGNERSAAIVAAYLMTMYAKDVVGAIQFISAQRFCTNFDEELKYLLRSYGDILDARRMISRAHQHDVTPQPAGQQQENMSFDPAAVATQASKKRCIEDTMDTDETGEFGMDMGRFEDRAPFQPFVQGQTDSTMKNY